MPPKMAHKTIIQKLFGSHMELTIFLCVPVKPFSMESSCLQNYMVGKFSQEVIRVNDIILSLLPYADMLIDAFLSQVS